MQQQKRVLFLCVFLGFAMPAHTNPLDDWMQPITQSAGHTIDTLTQHFVLNDGYTQQSEDRIVAALNERLNPSSTASALLPGSSLSPFVMAALVLTDNEATLSRVRYRIRYGTVDIDASPNASPISLSLIQIDRFNLGPLIRDALIAEVGPEHVAPPEAFGVGPHVSWRFLTRPLMGHRALPEAIARTEISDQHAQAMMCLGQACLSSGFVTDDAALWSQEDSQTEIPVDTVYRVTQDHLLTPAAAIDLLSADLSQEPRESVSDGEPFVEIVVEKNLGQDSSLQAAQREGAVMDDSIKAVWKLIRALPSQDADGAYVFSDTAYECRRGADDFAQPGHYCP